jgi:hypothetical protein
MDARIRGWKKGAQVWQTRAFPARPATIDAIWFAMQTCLHNHQLLPNPP